MEISRKQIEEVYWILSRCEPAASWRPCWDSDRYWRAICTLRDALEQDAQQEQAPSASPASEPKGLAELFMAVQRD